ncbi:MAG: hypothetical protein FWH11_11920 [Micrococcales bacterium]|nr:hypothetical protein [Micrococcales bacterium]
MRATTATARLTRLALRQDRSWLAWWLLGVGAYVTATAAAMRGAYPDQAAVDAYAATAGLRQTERLFNGPGHAVDTIGGLTVFEAGGYLLVAVALFGVFTVVRHTRTPEHDGRAELLAAAPVGRWAALAAACATAGIGALALGTVATAGLMVTGLGARGSAAYGTCVAGSVLVFAAVGTVTAQLSDNPRVALAAAGVALGAAYLVRGIGDLRDNGLVWASPLGWVQAVRPFADERLWPGLLALAGAAALVGLAAWLTTRRDLGAGIRATGPGPAVAAPALRTPTGLAVRLQRGTAVGWACGLGVLGLALGVLGDGVVAATGEVTGMPWAGPQAAELYYGFACLLLGALTGCAGIALTVRQRTEEQAGRTGLVCSGTWSRTRWFACCLGVTLAATVVVLLVAATGLAVGRAVSTDGPFLGTVTHSLAYLPAVWVLVAVATLLVAAAPGWTPLAWASAGYVLVVALLAAVLKLPGWAQDLSPFTHAPGLDDDLTDPRLLVLTGIAALVTTSAGRSFRRRNLVA